MRPKCQQAIPRSFAAAARISVDVQATGDDCDDAPIDVKPQELELRPPNSAALRAELYRELGFSSLLKELGSERCSSARPARSQPPRRTTTVCQRPEFRKYVTELPRKEPWQSG